jgi:hypothetical protein
MNADNRPSQTAQGAGHDVWQARQRYWQRKLGRLRLGVEPLPEQLVRYRRVTWMLTAVPLVIALMFVSLFAAFRRPDIGLILASVLLLPIVVFAWLEYGLLVLRVARYTREQARMTGQQTTPGRT